MVVNVVLPFSWCSKCFTGYTLQTKIIYKGCFWLTEGRKLSLLKPLTSTSWPTSDIRIQGTSNHCKIQKCISTTRYPCVQYKDHNEILPCQNSFWTKNAKDIYPFSVQFVNFSTQSRSLFSTRNGTRQHKTADLKADNKKHRLNVPPALR